MGRKKSADAITPAARAARYRETRAAEGGRAIPRILLSPEDSAKLAELELSRQATRTEIVRQLIREATPQPQDIFR